MGELDFKVLGGCVDAGLVVVDEHGVVTYANRRFAELCDLHGESLIGYRLDAIADIPWHSGQVGRSSVTLAGRSLDMHAYGMITGQHECHQLLLFASQMEAEAPSDCDLAARYNLSAREADILTHALEGMRVEAMAETCSISAHTVRNHLKSIYRKLGVHSRVQLMHRCLDDGCTREPRGG